MEQNNNANVVDKNVPIPTNFYYVGGTKDTGVVISDNSADENQGVDSNLSGNQFVWVPVEQNQKLMLDVTALEDIAGLKLIGPDGTETEFNTITDAANKTGVPYSTIYNILNRGHKGEKWGYKFKKV